jgi:predicted transcriptional regulator
VTGRGQGGGAGPARAAAGDARRRYREARRAAGLVPEPAEAPGAPAPDGGHPAEPGVEGAAQRLLGDLEAEIMEVMWRRERSTVREVREELRRRRELAHTTVMTVMARLAEKGLLRRERAGRAHAYEVALTPDAFVRGASQRLVRTLIVDFGDVAIAAMAEELERVDPGRLDRLRQQAGKARRRPGSTEAG